MNNVVDVAARILDECGYLSTMKLQKLVYYSHAYHLVKYGAPLFSEDIEAWANGPVVPKLFYLHSGRFVIQRGFFDNVKLSDLDETAISAIEATLTCFGDYSGSDLSKLTHSEDPWKNARKGCAPDERSQERISDASIRDFYQSPNCTNPLFSSASC